MKDDSNDPVPATTMHWLIQQMRAAEDILTPRDRELLKMRFIYNNTREEVGQRFGITAIRVRQLEVVALHKLRHPSRYRR
jgi:RNA polymerase primary sigma factor